jgi:hypothetical protein
VMCSGRVYDSQTFSTSASIVACIVTFVAIIILIMF